MAPARALEKAKPFPLFQAVNLNHIFNHIPLVLLEALDSAAQASALVVRRLSRVLSLSRSGENSAPPAAASLSFEFQLMQTTSQDDQRIPPGITFAVASA